MHCQLKTISHYIDELLNPASFQDVCINGIQIEGKKNVRHIATSVSATLQSIQKAKRLKADILLVHHGLFLKGKDLTLQDCLKEKLKILLNADMSLLAYHLPLDAHVELGNNWPAAKMLGFFELEPFGYFSGVPIGVKARCEPMSQITLKNRLRAFYGRHVETALFGAKTIQTVAIVSGSGHKLLLDAAHQGIDCLITGTVDEPVWYTAREEKINFMACGHSATEKLGVQLLGEHLADKFDLTHTFIDDNNPF